MEYNPTLRFLVTSPLRVYKITRCFETHGYRSRTLTDGLGSRDQRDVIKEVKSPITQ
ncbi:hypothetical protein BDR04DRAFT_1101931 [Suillus decipiens]|nr:hypothetical protein BDR04DRAFT_1101931 [Suillus decipiens]